MAIIFYRFYRTGTGIDQTIIQIQAGRSNLAAMTYRHGRSDILS